VRPQVSRFINNVQRALIAHTQPKSPITESYRTLRTNIEFSAIDGQLKKMMITSAGPGEGKSTTAINLAIVYAQSEKKVALVDADLRKPVIHRIFQISNRKGLTTFLTGQNELSEVLYRSHVDHLDLLPAGPIPPNPAEMLASRRMATLLEDLAGKYDVVILDTPPVLAVTDAQIIASQCDGVLFVISQGKVKRDLAVKAKAGLEHVKARILGTVLNNVDRNSGESYYYYYYYGNKEENPPAAEE